MTILIKKMFQEYAQLSHDEHQIEAMEAYVSGNVSVQAFNKISLEPKQFRIQILEHKNMRIHDEFRASRT